MTNTKILASATAENNGLIYKTSIVAGGNAFVADEPKELGGGETGPTPSDYLCMALASCKVITMRMYAQRKGWLVDDIKVKVDFVKGDKMATGLNTFFCEVNLVGEVNDEQRKRLLEIAKVCPVERLLSKPTEVVTVIA